MNTFAQTPSSATRLANGGFYDVDSSSHHAIARARAEYACDPDGRTTAMEDLRDSWGGSAYACTRFLADWCTYEISTRTANLNRSTSLGCLA